MHIITITKTQGGGGYLADVHQTSNQQLQGFGTTEIEALERLMEKIKEHDDKFIKLSTKTDKTTEV